MEIGEEKTFKAYSDAEPMARFNGQRCTILSVVSDPSRYEATGVVMYSAKFEDGRVHPVFEDELTD